MAPSIPVSNVLKALLQKLLEVPDLKKSDVKDLRKIVTFTDVRLEGVRTLHLLLKERTPDQRTESCLKNALLVTETLLDSINTEKVPVFNNADSQLAKQDPETNYSEFKKQFSQLWFEIMKWDKPKSVHKKILVLLPEKVLKHLTKPLHMSDYLLSAFDLGGPLSLMALQGIFVLMTTYNFEITDFYSRLYSMFQSSIFHAKYKARFFAYSSEFLRSTHLPEYLVSAFVKRIARLSLHAPAPCIPLIFDFITNLLVQHPGLQKLIKREGGPAKYDKDPYIHEEADPMKSHAIESMLWEIKSLQKHAIPEIAIHAQFFEKPIPRVEKDLDDTLNLTYEDLFENESKKKKSYKLISPAPKPRTPLFRPFPTTLNESDDDK